MTPEELHKERLIQYIGLLEEGLDRQSGRFLKDYVESCIGRMKSELKKTTK